MKRIYVLPAVASLLASLSLVACNGGGYASDGLPVSEEEEETINAESFDDLPDCSSELEGDRAKVDGKSYVCKDGEWEKATNKDSKNDDDDDEDDDGDIDDPDGDEDDPDNDGDDDDSSSSKKKSSSSVKGSSSSSAKSSASGKSSGSGSTTATKGPVGQYGQLQAGTNSSGKGRIYGSCKGVSDGNEVAVQGMSLFWSIAGGSEGADYWTADYVNELVSRHHIQLIRGPMGVDGDWGYGNYFTETSYYQSMMDAVVQAAIDNGIYVIIDYHSHEANTNVSNAKSFFSRMAQKWGKYDNVIFEIFNEPIEQTWSTIKSYANQVIPVIREYSDNLIVVGTPNYSANPDAAVGSAISDNNVAYTFHFYAGVDQYQHDIDVQGANAEYAMRNGLSVFVTEWGNSGPTGAGSVVSSRSSDWYNWMKTNKLSGANWAVSSKDEAAAYFTTSGPWSYSTSGSWVNSNIFANLPTSYTACSGGTTPVTSSSSGTKSSASTSTGSDALGGDGMFEVNGGVASSWTLSKPKSVYGYGVESGINDDGNAVLAFWSPGYPAVEYGYEIQATHRVTLKQGYSYQLYVIGYSYDESGAASRYVDMSIVDSYYDSYVGWSFDISDASPYVGTSYCHTYSTDSYAEFHIDGGESVGGFDVLEVRLIEKSGC